MMVERPKDMVEVLVFLLPMVIAAVIILIAIPTGTPYKTIVGGVISYLVGHFTFLAYRRRKK